MFQSAVLRPSNLSAILRQRQTFSPTIPCSCKAAQWREFLWLVGQTKKKKKRRRRTGALQALNCLDDLDPAGLIDELAIQLWPRGARFAVLHVVPNGLILASIRHSCVFFRWSPLRFWATRSRVNCTLPYPSIGGWWTVPVFLFFSFQKDLFTFPVQVGSVPACFLFFSLFHFFSPWPFMFWTNSIFSLLWVPIMDIGCSTRWTQHSR